MNCKAANPTCSKKGWEIWSKDGSSER